MNRSERHFCPHLSALGGCELNKSLRFVSIAHQNESLEGIKDGKVILPAWLGTCTLPHRCSLFTGAAINLHARGYESPARRAEFKSQKEFFKVRGSSDQIEQLSCLSGLANASLWRRWAAALLTDIMKMQKAVFPPFGDPKHSSRCCNHNVSIPVSMNPVKSSFLQLGCRRSSLLRGEG